VTPSQNDSLSEVRSEFGSNERFATLSIPDAVRVRGTFRKTLRRLAQTAWESLGCVVYIVQGRLPLSKGYREYRERYVRKSIGNNDILQIFGSNRMLPDGYGARLDERVVEYPWALSRLSRYTDKSRFLDAGSTFNHETILLHPAVKGHKWSILTLSPETKCFWDLGISYLFEDLRAVPFQDDWFDAVACISVIEHVGMDNVFFATEKAYRENHPQDYLRAVSEMRRIIRPGGSLFLSVPFGRYENHGWLQQFNSDMLSTLISEFQPRNVYKTFFCYTERGWKLAEETECRDLSFSDAIRNKHSVGKNRVRVAEPDFAVAARAVACIELQK
jgi:SAM-dependent methyltransferase